VCQKSQNSSFSLGFFLFGSVYFAINGKSTAGTILPLAEPDWLNLLCDKDDTL